MAASSDPPQKKRLDSWKEIAAFFARAERTVKRWEAQRGLPVHRVPGGARSAVFAYSDELTDWLKGPGREPDSYRSPDDPGQPPARAVASRTETFVSQRIISWLLLVVLVPSVAVFVERSRPYLKASATRHVPDPEAQELYLKGRFFWTRRTPDDLNRAIDYFTQAIVKDPNGAQAYVGL